MCISLWSKVSVPRSCSSYWTQMTEKTASNFSLSLNYSKWNKNIKSVLTIQYKFCIIFIVIYQVFGLSAFCQEGIQTQFFFRTFSNAANFRRETVTEVQFLLGNGHFHNFLELASHLKLKMGPQLANLWYLFNLSACAI